MALNSTLASEVFSQAHRRIIPFGNPQSRHRQLCREELDLLCHALSHDLRAPLRSIEGFSRVLLESLCEKLDEQSAAYFRHVINASNEMGRLLDGLLQLTRVTRHVMHKTLIDLGDLAQRVVTGLRDLYPERNVKVTIAPGLSAFGDPLLLKLALEHLFENAWKFTRRQKFPEISFGGNQIDTGMVFYLHDNGIGFDMAYYQRLFGVFERLHNLPDLPGSGIGLSIVKRIVQRHHGNIWANAIPNLGACFWFDIPSDGPYETTTLHSHDRRQCKRRDACKDRPPAAIHQV
jgi:light-regulated signal transduction histidine kinase (bacteriophytochrome)